MSNPLQQGTRWATVTPDDHSGTLYVITFLSFTYTSMTVLTRVLIKRNMLGIDDGTMVVAQVRSLLVSTPSTPLTSQAVNIVQFALLTSSLSAGLAKSYHTITYDQYSHMATVYSPIAPIHPV